MLRVESEERGGWGAVGLPALTVVLGMQTLRVLLPLLVFVLRDRIGWSAIELGQLALAIFLTGFLTALVRRLVGPDRLLLVTAGGLGLFRLAIQLWAGDPLIDLWLAVAATILFILFLPTCLGRVRGGDAGHFALGLLLGLAVDTALHGAFATYDVAWQAGPGPALLTLALVLTQWLLLAASLRTGAGGVLPASDGPFWPTLGWLAFGPVLFLQMLIFENIARLTALTGWTPPLAFGWALSSHAAGLAVAAWVISHGRRSLWPAVVALAVGLVVAVAPSSPRGLVAASLFLAGQIAMAGLLAAVLVAIDARATKAGLARTTVAHGVGMLLLMLFLFLYYSGYDIALPFANTALPAVAGLIVGLCAVGAALVWPARLEPRTVEWRPAALVAFLLVLPLVQLVAWRTPVAVAGTGYPVRLMTYNLHTGFDTDGFPGMEALARVIEAQRPDVVALQEVSRGWVIAGSVDMLTWLSQRLDMPYISGPTADPVWGNAILSRFPIVEHQAHDLPPRDLRIRRGFLWARIDVGQGQALEVIATHFHHIEADSAVRVTQSRAILDFWATTGGAVLMGDLNAGPGDPEIEMLDQAGLQDVLELAGVAPGYTYPSFRPDQRIDYIRIASSLTADRVTVTTGTASDHLGVAATVVRQ